MVTFPWWYKAGDGRVGGLFFKLCLQSCTVGWQRDEWDGCFSTQTGVTRCVMGRWPLYRMREKIKHKKRKIPMEIFFILTKTVSWIIMNILGFIIGAFIQYLIKSLWEKQWFAEWKSRSGMQLLRPEKHILNMLWCHSKRQKNLSCII